MICKECPAFVIHHGEIDDDHGIVVQRTLRIDSPCNPLLSGAGLTDDHNRKIRLSHLFDGGL